MKKLTGYGLIAIAVLVMVIGGTFAIRHEDNAEKAKATSSSSPENSSQPTSSKATSTKNGDACSLLTSQIAQETIGNKAATSSSNGLVDTDTQDSKVTACTYMVEGDTPESHAEATLMVRTAKTTLGAHTNQIAFGSDRPKNTTIVKGVGNSAFWSQSKGELDVLDHNNWYTFTILHDTSPSKTKLSEVEQLAKRILGQL